MKTYAEENSLLKQPQQMLISSFNFSNGKPITPLLIFYLDLGLQSTKFDQYVQSTQRTVFNSFDQSVVDARRAGYENPISHMIAETMKFLENCSFGLKNYGQIKTKHDEISRRRECPKSYY